MALRPYLTVGLPLSRITSDLREKERNETLKPLAFALASVNPSALLPMRLGSTCKLHKNQSESGQS